MRVKNANQHKDKEITDRLVKAAEYVFAEKGLEKATLREITARAKVNVAAVSYYFGSKSDLVLSVFDQLSTRLNNRRTADLDACLATASAAGKPPDLKSILESFIRPYLDGKSGRLFARLVLQHRLAPSDVTRAIVSSHFDPMAKRFIQAIADACPDIDPVNFFWRYVFMTGAVVYAVADIGLFDRTTRLSDGRVRTQKAEDLHDALLDFLIGGMTRDPRECKEKVRSLAKESSTAKGLKK